MASLRLSSGETLGDGTLKVTGVVTSDGATIRCNEVVLACGQWTRQLAAQAGVNVPVAIVPHQYIVFDRMVDEDNVGLVTNHLPVVRDYESQIYIKPEVGGLMVGAFEGPHVCMPPNVAQRNDGSSPVPANASHELYDGTADKMDDGLVAAMSLVPRLAECTVARRNSCCSAVVQLLEFGSCCCRCHCFYWGSLPTLLRVTSWHVVR